MKRYSLLVGLVIYGVFLGDLAKASKYSEAALLAEQKVMVQQLKKRLAELSLQGLKAQERAIEEARYSYWLGLNETGTDDKLNHYEHGRDLLSHASQMGLSSQSDINPDILLLWAANAGGAAGIKKDFAALSMVDKIVSTLKKVQGSSPSFANGAADRALANIYFHAPRFISVGSKRKALSHAKLAFEQDPHHPGNLIIMGKIALDNGQDQVAHDYFKVALELATPEHYPYDYVAWHLEAKAGIKECAHLKS